MKPRCLSKYDFRSKAKIVTATPHVDQSRVGDTDDAG